MLDRGKDYYHARSYNWKKISDRSRRVVTKSVPQYCVAAGNPAKIIKKFDFEQGKWVKV